jgi:hypothetical protein
VSYFGLDENERPNYRRYYCYYICSGPGATPGSGVAMVTTLAVHNEAERCTYCQNFHTVTEGGPAAALEAAIGYLDAYHEQDHLRKVQSAVRGLPLPFPSLPAEGSDTRVRGDQTTTAVLSLEA